MTDQQPLARISRTLSFWLRHDPAAGGIELDARGWADVGAVLSALERTLRQPVSLELLKSVVWESDKQRFALEDGRIRANQGHSFDAGVEFRSVEPPAVLYHGTTVERWQAIQASDGLAKMQRHHVHLSADAETAGRVAARHRGETALVLVIDAGAARAAGREFFISENGVYLTDAVPLDFIEALR